MVRVRTAAWMVGVLWVVALATGCKSTVPENPGRTTWNQEEVTSLAKDLSAAITQVRQTTNQEPYMRDRTGSNQLAKSLYRENMKDLETACRQLVRKLEAGDGYEETYGTARKIGTLLRDAQTNGRKLMGTESQWTAIDPAVDIIEKLAPYYSTTSPLMPQTLDR